MDWAILSPKVDAALDAHAQAEFHKGEMEKEYAERDKAMPEILKAVQQSVSLLKASFGSNPKKLANWGLAVDDTPKAKKPKDGGQ